MAGDPSVFTHVYELQFSGGQFALVDTTSAGTNVTVKDDINDGSGDVHTEIGDVPGDHFDVQRSGGLNGSYTFVTVAQTADNAVTGMIARDAAGHYFYFTNGTVGAGEVGPALQPMSGGQEVCFMPGTLIRTPDGETAVEDLQIGDVITAIDGSQVPVRWIGKQTVAVKFADELRLPIRIKADALGDTVPSRDLLLSADHAVLVDGALIHAGALVNGTSIVRERNVPAIFTYYHVETTDHALILAENAPAETFIDNVGRQRFDNRAEYEALYPDAPGIVEMPYPRAKAYRQVPPAIRTRLELRGQELAGKVARAA